MSKIGFCNDSIGWFKSYLTRTQVVKFDKDFSTELPVQTGTGQGTILVQFSSFFTLSINRQYFLYLIMLALIKLIGETCR